MEWRENELAALFPSVAAQLRTGLSNIYLAARMIAPGTQREQSPELDERAAVLDQNYYRVLRLVNNLSAASYLMDDRPLPLQSGDIVDLIGENCAQAGDLAALLGIQLSFQTPVSYHQCRFHRDGMKLLVGQLLSNAVKFTASGGRITVELRFDEKAKLLILSVTDTGCGISEELLPTLFNRYYHQERRDPYPHGLGLGLPLCRRIAEGHGGSILAQSKPGRGSRFIVSIPDLPPVSDEVEVSDAFFDATGGFNPMLLALSDSLPLDAFHIRSDES